MGAARAARFTCTGVAGSTPSGSWAPLDGSGFSHSRMEHADGFRSSRSSRRRAVRSARCCRPPGNGAARMRGRPRGHLGRRRTCPGAPADQAWSQGSSPGHRRGAPAGDPGARASLRGVVPAPSGRRLLSGSAQVRRARRMALGGTDREAGSLRCCEESHCTTNIWAVPSEPAGEELDIASCAGGSASTPLSNTVPCVDDLTRAQRIVSSLAIAVAVGLLVACGYRLFTGVDLWQWWVPLACVGGIAAADFGSGLVHWAADTWGRDDLPVIGSRLLVPFRVHHVNPDDFVRRRFVDTNGDVAFLTVPALAGLLAVPLGTTWGGPAAVFGFALCGLGMMTNQIHQWAHMPSPPRPIRVLQDCGMVLGRAGHAAHHERPYDVHYCITTGWCNRP